MLRACRANLGPRVMAALTRAPGNHARAACAGQSFLPVGVERCEPAGRRTRVGSSAVSRTSRPARPAKVHTTMSRPELRSFAIKVEPSGGGVISVPRRAGFIPTTRDAG
jgi:hypothetical protein